MTAREAPPKARPGQPRAPGVLVDEDGGGDQGSDLRTTVALDAFEMARNLQHPALVRLMGFLHQLEDPASVTAELVSNTDELRLVLTVAREQDASP